MYIYRLRNHQTNSLDQLFQQGLILLQDLTMHLNHTVDEVDHTLLEPRRQFLVQQYVRTSSVLDDHAQMIVQYCQLLISQVTECVEAVVSVVLIPLTNAYINEFQDWFNQCLVLLGLTLLHILDIVE